jgi:hypothetical protein
MGLIGVVFLHSHTRLSYHSKTLPSTLHLNLMCLCILPLPMLAKSAPYFRVLPPKDVASLIAEIDIKINGQTIQHLTRYNDIANILNALEHPETAKIALQGFDPSVVYEKTGAGNWQDISNAYHLTPHPNNLNNKPKKYIINHWYGLLGHRGKDVSSNFIDTNILGEVTIAFVFATPSTCAKVVCDRY